MPDVNTALAWIGAHRPLAITVGVAIALLIVSIIAAQVWAGYRGRSRSTRASIGFGVVQAGVAYVTITGVYGFWRHLIGMPVADAVFTATIVEAATWAAVGMVFAYAADPAQRRLLATTLRVFWWAIATDSLMAVAGSPAVPIAVGRAVVVGLGAQMWLLRIRAKVPTIERAPTKLLITPRRLMIEWGVLAADEEDVVHSPHEWQVRRLTRAIRRKAEGSKLAKWRGHRSIIRVMESGDVRMVSDAQRRYALQTILGDDLAADSPSMRAAIEAARAALYPPSEPEPAEPPCLPASTPVPQPETVAATPRPRRRTLPDAAGQRRTAPASEPRADREANAQTKAAAIDRAFIAITEHDGLLNGSPITGRTLGAEFGMQEEWGRLRLAEARRMLADAQAAPPAVNP